MDAETDKGCSRHAKDREAECGRRILPIGTLSCATGADASSKNPIERPLVRGISGCFKDMSGGVQLMLSPRLDEGCIRYCCDPERRVAQGAHLKKVVSTRTVSTSHAAAPAVGRRRRHFEFPSLRLDLPEGGRPTTFQFTGMYAEIADGYECRRSDRGTDCPQDTRMSCASCARTIERVLSRVPGVTSGKVDFALGIAIVTGAADAARLVEAVEAAGYGASSLEESR